MESLQVTWFETESTLGQVIAQTLANVGLTAKAGDPTQAWVPETDFLESIVVLGPSLLQVTPWGGLQSKILLPPEQACLWILTEEQASLCVPEQIQQLEVLVLPLNAQTLRLQLYRLRQHSLKRATEVDDLQIWQQIPDPILFVSVFGRVLEMNQAASRFFGQRPRGSEHVALASLYEPSNEFGEGLPLLRFDQASQQSRVVHLQRDGKNWAFNERQTVLRRADGEWLGLLIWLSRQPISETLAAQNWGDYLQLPVVVLNSQDQVLFYNRAAQQLLDWSSALDHQADWWQKCWPEFRAKYETQWRTQWPLQGEVLDIHLTQPQKFLELRTFAYEDSVILFWIDVTQRRQQLLKVNRQDRLDSLSRLARGFAHDFNNLLTVLLGNLSIARMAQQDQAELDVAHQVTLQAQNLVQQLLTFAHGGRPVLREVCLQQWFEHFRAHYPQVVHLRYQWKLAASLPTCRIDSNQLRRLLGNILRNAEQASVTGGRILVAVSWEHSTLHITVQDEGVGITQADLSQVFEPYFSTKKAQNATGLGLTVCESIVQAHGGHIHLQSTQPGGTLVKIDLPLERVEKDNGSSLENTEQVSSKQVLHTQPSIEEGIKRILILEDDDQIRQLMCRTLQTQAYEVSESMDGRETYRLYEQALSSQSRYDLVILDLSVPEGWGGVETMQHLLKLDPNVKGLVSSGYSDDPALADPARYGFCAVLPKPYEPKDLVLLVKQLLEG